MAMHRLEVYVNTYRSKPFVKDFEGSIDLTPNDEKQLEEWIGVLAGKPVRICDQIRIEDIKHHFCDTMERLVHATCIRVSIIDEAA